MYKIMLVDDHPIVREGIFRLISTRNDMKVVAQANSGNEAYELLKEIELDIVITDFSMPGISGLKFIEKALARKSDLKIIMCSMHSSTQIVNFAYKLGAKGFVSKSANPTNILDAIRASNENRFFLSEDLQNRSDYETCNLDQVLLESLSVSEFETFKMLAKGSSLATIAKDLNLSEKTINNYQTKIRTKLQLQTPAQLVHFALRNRIIMQTLPVKFE
jgi:DNA-binding NarL/FixJ family response regulator